MDAVGRATLNRSEIADLGCWQSTLIFESSRNAKANSESNIKNTCNMNVNVFMSYFYSDITGMRQANEEQRINTPLKDLSENFLSFLQSLRF
jgi:hypothetical protein